MYVKVTKSGDRRYIQLVEAYRDDNGRPRHRTVATLGRADQIAGELDSVINGLLRASGRAALDDDGPSVEFDPARSFGDVFALNELWKQLGFDALRLPLRSRRQFDAEQLLRVMVFNRLCDPASKLGVLDWLKTTAFPGVDVEAVTHQQLLRTMDALESGKERVEDRLSQLLRPLVDEELSVVFYDLTTITVTGRSVGEDDIRAYGRSKEGGIARQVLLGVVQTADGLPIAHEVHAGNTAEGGTLMPMITRLIDRYPIRRVILVADRGLLSLDTLDALEAITLPSGKPLEYLMAVPAARYDDFTDLIARARPSGSSDWCVEATWKARRLIIDHRAERAALARQMRRERIEELEAQAAHWADKLDGQDEGRRHRGRRLSDSGAKARFYHAVREAHLAHVIKVDLKGELFTYDIDRQVLARLEALDGKLLLVTNVADHDARSLVARYHALADIERGFRVLKSEIEIGPIYHRLPKRIRAHAMICFLALVLHRVMRMRLKAAGADTSPERTLASFRDIQRHRIRINKTRSICGMSSMAAEQLDLFSALSVPRPTSDDCRAA